MANLVEVYFKEKVVELDYDKALLTIRSQRPVSVADSDACAKFAIKFAKNLLLKGLVEQDGIINDTLLR
jgi:hypothetical protein